MATCELRNVLHVPSFVYSLISVPTLAEGCLVVLFSNYKVTILRKDVLLATGSRIRGLYFIDLFNTPRCNSTALATASLQLWHERMAHVHSDGILTMARNNVVTGMELPPKSKDTDIREACIAGKMHRAPIPRASATRAEGLLDLIHTDVAGTLPVPSKGSSLYFVTFINDRSRYLTVFPIKSKSDCFSCFLKFRSSVETQREERLRQYGQMGAASTCQMSLKHS